MSLRGVLMILFQEEPFSHLLWSHCVVLAPCSSAWSSLVRRLFGEGVENISSEGFRINNVNPPLLLDIRAESWCLGAGVCGKYLKVLVPGWAMALLNAAFSKFFFLISISLIRISQQQFFSSFPCFPLLPTALWRNVWLLGIAGSS